MSVFIDSDDCIVFGPRSVTCPGWPVRIEGMQGLWRYVGVAQGDPYAQMAVVEVIGPFFPSNPSRNGGRSRIFSYDKLRYAGKKAKPADVRNVQSEAISEQAKRHR